MPIDIDKLPVEERDAVLQFGKISRPFSKELRAQPIIARIASAYYALQAAKEWEVLGVDVSYWQGEIDYAMLATKAQFAITRGGYGNDYFDPTLNPNIVGFIDNKIVPGIYWYTKPDKSFLKHAQSFWSVVKAYSCPIYPMFDLEETCGLGKTALESWYYKMYAEFCNLSGRELEHTMTYSSAGFLNTAIGLTAWMKRTKLDVAHWTSAPEPIIPNEWKVAEKTWKIWQYGVVDSTGYGVESAKIDVQRYNGTRVDFNAEFGTSLPLPPPPTMPAFIVVNTAELNLRSSPTDAISTNILGLTQYGKRWKTTGVQQTDGSGRVWYQLADEHGQAVWVASWLVRPG